MEIQCFFYQILQKQMGNISCSPSQLHNRDKQQKQIVVNQSKFHIAQLTEDCSTPDDSESETHDPLTIFLGKDFLNTSIRASSDLMDQGYYTKLLLSWARKTAGRRQSIQYLFFNGDKKDQIIQKNEQLNRTDMGTQQSQQIFKQVSQFLITTQTGKSQCFLPIRVKIQNFIKIKKQSISQYYQLSNKIGQGAFGSVYKARCLKSNQFRAVKVLKQKKMPQGQKINLLAQIELLKKLDHPHIIKLYDLFLYNNFYYVVTEFCEGGSVLNIVRNKIVTGPMIIKIMKQLFSGLAYLHNNQIVHRDIKLQNLVLMKQIESQNDEIEIKLIDFGLASSCHKKKMKKTGHVGTYQYMAPQVIKGTFNEKSDVWSCGVILYAFLTGSMPFKGKNTKQTINQIIQKQINFGQKKYDQIDNVLKSLLVCMLQKNPQKRISIQRAMHFDCFKERQAVQLRISPTEIANLSKYYRGSNFVTIVQSYLSIRTINQTERKKMADIFNQIDKDGNGTIEVRELIQIYQNFTGVTNSVQVEQIVSKIDHNKSGKIDFSEFLIAMYSRERLFDQKSLLEAFDHFDTDKTGYLQKKQIKDALSGCKKSQIRKVFEMLDKDGDEKISKEEFLSYLLAY